MKLDMPGNGGSVEVKRREQAGREGKGGERESNENTESMSDNKQTNNNNNNQINLPATSGVKRMQEEGSMKVLSSTHRLTHW